MIKLEIILLAPAALAGIDIPMNIFVYDEEKYAHWNMFRATSLYMRTPNPKSYLKNARVIASIPKNDILDVSWQDLIDRGLEIILEDN